jgi:hypothetical protein
MRYLMGTALAAGLVLASGGVSWGNDVVRLGGPAAQASIEGGTNNALIRGGHGGGGHGGGGHGGYGGYRGGYYGGYRGGYYGGYRGGYYGGYGGYYGGYRGWGGGYYSPYYYGSYYPYYNTYYYSPYYYTPSYYYPIAGVNAPVATLQQSTYAPAPTQNYAPGYSPEPSGNGTFPYDGGPRNVMPMPPADGPAPMNGQPRGTIPLDGKLAGMPRETTGGVSPVVTPDIQRLNYVSYTSAAPQTSTQPRYTYPAYGEQPLPPAPRKIIK